MLKDPIGWLVRTVANGRHRYWKVGIVEATQAAAVAAKTANAETAQAVTRITKVLPHYSPRYLPIQGVAIEVMWESGFVTSDIRIFGSEQRSNAKEDILGEITFDIIVPQDGLTQIEGCYRLKGGNWLVYYLTNYQMSNSPIITPIINGKAVFSSGITGVVGFFPPGWLLNKKSVAEILAEVVGVDGWVEVTGPDSLDLK